VTTPPTPPTATADHLPLPTLPRRPRDGHKGTFGTVAVVGGSVFGANVMLGAPALSALAALRAGAGLVRLVMPEPILAHGLTVCPGATGVRLRVEADGDLERGGACSIIDQVAERADCLAVGPGLGDTPGSRALVLRAIQQDHLPLVLDADGLNALCGIAEFMRDFRAPAVLTPHPGEFARLVAALGLKGDLGLASSRERAAEQLAQRLGRVVVLKGAGTVVSDGLRTWTCAAGHPCLATAGTGDVLTGLIAALIAQFCPTPQQAFIRAKVPAAPPIPGKPMDLFDAARVGVQAHALAGEQWAKERGEAGLLAVDLADLLPAALESLRA
jgi:ADP-dependent NAD(P)H-hydrate dehydratase